MSRTARLVQVAMKFADSCSGPYSIECATLLANLMDLAEIRDATTLYSVLLSGFPTGVALQDKNPQWGTAGLKLWPQPVEFDPSDWL